MRFLAFLCFGLLLVVSPSALAKPNVLLILADDLGYSDLGCYGGEIHTPNLDALATEGVRFSRFYNTARCWPTRAAILTGYYAQQVGRDALPNVKGGAGGQRPRWATLLPSLLKPLGYRSYHSGKWHLDGKPIQEGFDRAFTLGSQNRYFAPGNSTLDDKPIARRADEANYYLTTDIADHAIAFLQEHAREYADQPFFQYLAFTAPHFPLMAPAADIAKYRDAYSAGWDAMRVARWERIRKLGLVGGKLSALEPAIGPPYHFADALEILGSKEVNREVPWEELTAEQKAFQAAKMEIHAAMVDRMDYEIGRVLEQIKTMGCWDDTLILFLSDNGASAEIMIRGDGHHNEAPLGSAMSYLCLGPGFSSAANTPFRRHKTWVHEGGISTPLIAHWPAAIKDSGALRHQVGHVIDLAPTLVELAGGVWPQQVEGREVPSSPGLSLASTLRQDSQVERTLWWLHEGNRALLHGNFKVVAAKGEPWHLYDLTNDRAEEEDLVQQQPELAYQLQQQWEQLTKSFELQATQ